MLRDIPKLQQLRMPMNNPHRSSQQVMSSTGSLPLCMSPLLSSSASTKSVLNSHKRTINQNSRAAGPKLDKMSIEHPIANQSKARRSAVRTGYNGTPKDTIKNEVMLFRAGPTSAIAHTILNTIKRIGKKSKQQMVKLTVNPVITWFGRTAFARSSQSTKL